MSNINNGDAETVAALRGLELAARMNYVQSKKVSQAVLDEAHELALRENWNRDVVARKAAKNREKGRYI